MAKLARFILYLIPLIIFGVLALFFWRGLQQNPTVIPSPLLNKPLPSLSAMTLDDNPPVKTSNQDFLGHLTLLNVWASWCSACQNEHAQLTAIANSKKIYLYGLNYKDTRENALNYLKKAGNPYFLTIYDPKGDFALNLGVYGTPETFLIDQNGIIRYKYTGPITMDVWQKEILPIIGRLTQPNLNQPNNKDIK